MSFTPYQIWKAAYPELKAGELFKIQNIYYMIIQVRHNRKAVAVTGSQTNYILALDNAATAGTTSTFLESMTGNLNKNRIVHIEYVALTVADTPEFIWGTQPLQSKDVADTLNANLAGATNPIEVDRWSYDQSMRLLVTQGNVSQIYYFDIVEYEIVSYAGQPTQPYWQLLSNGAGIYVANEAIAANIQASNLGLPGTSKPIPRQ
jgi:hypothetical protein